MSHFAQIQNGIVVQVIVAEQDFIDTLPDASEWVQTSYNTRGGIHYDPVTKQPSAAQSKARRKNYAGIGFTYDAVADMFIPPKPYPSWALDKAKGQHVAPVAMPMDGKLYQWDEATKTWISLK